MRGLIHTACLAKRKRKSLKDRARELSTDVPAVFLALKDKRTPWYAKLFAALTVAYAFSPIDLIPDFIPVLGYLDDLIILPLLITLTVKFIPGDTFSEYRSRAAGLFSDGKPKKWYYALPIILTWLIIIAIILLIIFL